MSEVPFYLERSDDMSRPEDPQFYLLARNGLFFCRNHGERGLGRVPQEVGIAEFDRSVTNSSEIASASIQKSAKPIMPFSV